MIKIDRYFMSNFDNPDVRGILKFTVSLSRDLGKRVIVEGVETLAQREYLEEIGCEYAQGKFFTAPLEASIFEAEILKIHE